MSAINHRAKRRRRKPPMAYHTTTTEEERLLHQAIQNSKLDQRRPKDGKLDIPWGPTFYPTIEEFEGNPLDYIEKIRSIGERYGLIKIVPPAGWNPPFCVDFASKKEFQTKHQLLHRLQEGISFGDGEEYTAAEYSRMASEWAKEWKAKNYPDHDLLRRTQKSTSGVNDSREEKCYTPENLERDYWDLVEMHTKEVAVEYGNDVSSDVYGSGFPLSERGRSICGKKNPEKMKSAEPKFGTKDYYKETWWNLNNIPSAPDSVLRHVKVGINGINVPWLYYGSLFTTFCWHNEDNFLYSINYHHRGAPKLWYGVPGSKKDADGLEKVFKSYLSMKMRDVPDLMHHITTMFSPRLLQNAGVDVCKLLQHQGEFIITFPRAFHSGFSMGPNVGEAVNFASHDWISYGADANERYRSFGRPAVFSHDRLTLTMANHLREQKTYTTCRQLLEELERVVEEELSTRRKLIETGVRDVSHLITLPRNVLEKLDEESADYDDKRLCHACKHVCFFSAVACECSQSKVSCLRHSHFMCRCPTERKYLMIWSDEQELKATLKKVRDKCKSLKTVTDEEREASLLSETSESVAPGVVEDLARHRNEEICLENLSSEYYRSRENSNRVVDSPPKTQASSPPKIVPRAASTNLRTVSDELSKEEEQDDDEVEVVGVVAPVV